MSSGTLEDDAVESDPRLLFIYTYLSKTTKFKVDKWQKMMNTESYKTMIMDFLEKPQHSVLLVTLSSAGTLVPSLTFPTAGKTKSSYFARVKPEPITAENIRKCLIFGDISPRPLEDLAVLVEEVFVPVFCNPANHKGWPAVVVDDVKRHVIELKNMVYKVRGQINGQTLLPMPDGVSKVHQVEQRIIESNGEDVDLHLKSAIEGAVIKWVSQITDVLQETSSIVFKSSDNPLPFDEIAFWHSRVSNLECIYDQLRDPRVKKMASILELTDSAYYPSFRSVFRNVVAGVKEAKEISKYLKPLEKYLIKLESVELTAADSLLMPLLHMVCLIWSNCKYYCSSAKVINLLQLISNQIIDMANKYLEPTSLFQGEVQETIIKVQQVIILIEQFKELFEGSRARVVTLFQEDVEPIPWLFHSNNVFKRLNAYLTRLKVINEFFEIAMEYSKLEKVEVGGLNGRHLSAKVAAVFDEFNIAFNVFRSVTYDPVEPEDPSFLQDYKVFKGKVLDFDRRMAAIATLAFNECHNCEAIFKMISVWDTMLKRPIIKVDITPKYNIIIDILNNELDTVRAIYSEQMELYENNGFITVDVNWPPVAGGLGWILKMVNRISYCFENFKQFDNPIVTSPEGEYVIVKYEEMRELLSILDEEIFSNWCDTIPQICSDSLSKTLLLVDPDTRYLTLNFDKELDAGLREVRYLKLIGRDVVPDKAQELFDRSDQLWQFTFNLNLTISWYNQIRKDSKPEEFDLVENEVLAIDDLIDEAQSLLNWMSPNAWEYIESIRDLVDQLAHRVLRAQKNLVRIFMLVNTWSNVPLFNRKNLDKDNLLALDEAPDKVIKRYNELHQAGLEVSKLVAENFRLYFNVPLRVPPPPPPVDEIVEDELYEQLPPPPILEGAEAVADAETGETHKLIPKEEEVIGEKPKLSKLPSVEEGKKGSKISKGESIVITTEETEPEEPQEKETDVKKDSLDKEPEMIKKSLEKKSLLKKDDQEIKKPIEKGSPEKKGKQQTKRTGGKGLPKQQKKASVKKPPTPEPSIEPSMSEEMIQKVIDDEEKINKWNVYLDMVDDEVLSGLERAVDCSLGLFMEEMNPESERSPLFEVSLELHNMDIVFVPSLMLDLEDNHCFYGIINGLLEDIVHMAIRMPRVSHRRRSLTYMENVLMSTELNSMKNSILEKVKHTSLKVIEYSTLFDEYNYLWLDDRQLYLKQFLQYGHGLSSEEELLEGKVNEEGFPLLKETPPKLHQFKAQIDEYEGLYKELCGIENYMIFDRWMRVDNQPFKQALLNTVCKWGNMFKQHLVDFVINSLQELSNFIDDAEKGLSKPLVEGDYDGLITIMGFLMQVKDRQISTDNMFEPLKDIIELVKTYEMDFTEETYVLLQELPSRWNNTKKLAVGVKAAAMPLMQAEANTIRKRLILFDIRTNFFKEEFKQLLFFKWGCEHVYKHIDKAHVDLAELEGSMERLVEQAGLFEVGIPEFKIVKGLRKELKMAKMLWDYILIVLSWITDWESTQWKKIDSEAMDLELKKFAKEIRSKWSHVPED